MTIFRAVLGMSILMLPSMTFAQDADELARQTQNPVSSLVSVPLQANWDFGLGDRDAPGTLLNIQPVMPFAASAGVNIILRVIMPIASQPGADGARVNGFGDILATAFLTPAAPGRVIWGAGPAFLIPSATTSGLGSEKFGLGPSVVMVMQPSNWTLGFLFNHIWSVSGANDRSDVNQTFIQPFATYNLGNGVSAGISMEASANWEADETWTAPLLFSVNKVTTLGKQPMNLSVGAGPTVVSPEGGASWRFRVAATFLFPR